MMEPDLTPNAVPDGTPVPADAPVPAEVPVTAPPPREHPHAPLLHRSFTRLFRLNLAALLVNVLSNTFKLGEKIPALRIPLSLASLALSVLIVVTLWQMQRAVPRFRRAAIWSAVPLAATPLLLWINSSAAIEGLGRENLDALLLVLLALLLGILAVGVTAQYQKLSACAEAFDGYDGGFARKWRTLRTWAVVLTALLGALLALMFLLLLSQGAFFYLFGGTVLLALLLAVIIGVAVTSIVELVYQYRAARLFA